MAKPRNPVQAGQIRFEDGHVLTEAEAEEINREQTVDAVEPGITQRRFSYGDMAAAFAADPSGSLDEFLEELIKQRKR
jgi:hypothetical protein